MKRSGLVPVIVSAIAILLCIGIVAFLSYKFRVTYGWAVSADKDHVAAYTGVLAAIASFIGALVSAVVGLFSALAQRSLEDHKASLARAAGRLAMQSQALQQLSNSISDYRSALSLMELNAFTSATAAVAEQAFHAARRQLPIVDQSLKPLVLDFFQAGENILGRLRDDPAADQRQIWAQGIKEFSGALIVVEEQLRVALDELFR